MVTEVIFGSIGGQPALGTSCVEVQVSDDLPAELVVRSQCIVLSVTVEVVSHSPDGVAVPDAEGLGSHFSISSGGHSLPLPSMFGPGPGSSHMGALQSELESQSLASPGQQGK